MKVAETGIKIAQNYPGESWTPSIAHIQKYKAAKNKPQRNSKKNDTRTIQNQDFCID